MAKKKNKNVVAPKQTAASRQTAATKQDKKTWKERLEKFLPVLIPSVCVAFIVAMAIIFLYKKNSDVFFMIQLHSLFNDTSEFFSDCMTAPGGLLQWMGLWCTQLFYYPLLGISLLTALWVAVFFIIKKAFRMPAVATPLILIPVTALLISVIDLGYWIYVLKIPGYCFRETLGVMFAALIVWLARADRWCAVGSIAAALAYPLIGYYAPVASLCIVLASVMRKNWIGSGVVALTGIVAPLLWYKIYVTAMGSSCFTAGFPVFEKLQYTSEAHSMPFVIIVACLVVFALIPNYEVITKKLKVYGVGLLTVAMLAVCAFATNKLQYDDSNFRAECRAYADAEEQDWEDLLNTVADVDGNITRELIILKNIALLETGNIGNTMYHYDDKGIKPNIPDSMQVHMIETATPLIHLYHGETNYAYRWAMENSVEYGFNITELKIMTIAALINGETVLAEKYLNILSHTMYYEDWAERFRPALKDAKSIRNYPEVKHIVMLNDFMSDRIDSDGGLVEKFIMNYYANSFCVDNAYVREACMAYALITKDIPTFWRQFMHYANYVNEMPIHYQEAAYLYGVLEPQTMNTSRMPFDKQRIVDRYARFDERTQKLLKLGLTTEAVAEETKTEFGDTFWWTYFFNKGSHYY